ncbi:MAG: RNase H family protein [Alcanivorax sp.]
MGKNKDVHVYVDGSAHQDTNKYGVGWVRADHKDRIQSEKSKRLSVHRACSTAAEVYAAQDALDHVRKNSKVVVHSDSAAVCEAIAENNFYEKIKRSSKNKPLRKAWESLERAVDRHKEVSAMFTQQSQHPYMQKAHNNAQTGANLRFNKAGIVDKHEQKHEKDTIMQDIEDYEEIEETISAHNENDHNHPDVA